MSEPTQPPSSSPTWFAQNATTVSDPKWDYGIFSGKNAIIIILLILVILSIIGINLLYLFGNVVDTIADVFGPIVGNLLALIGISTGELINTTADVAANAAILGVDIAKGTTHSIGDLLIHSGKGGISEEEKKRLDQALTSPKCPTPQSSQPAPAPAPTPVQTSEPTVTTIASQKPKAGWCYIGDYSGSRGCVMIEEHNKCMSGQVFPSQTACLHPENSR